MRRIYRFDTLNHHAITVDEIQTEPDQVTLRVHTSDQLLALSFAKEEFEELCQLRYRLDFPAVTTSAHKLALVVA